MGGDLKQVILVRRDLRLRKSAAAALVARASAQFLIDNDTSEEIGVMKVALSVEETEWLNGGSSRIVLGVPSEASLRALVFKAEVEGIPCQVISGRAPEKYEREGEDEFLCAALGPDQSSKIDVITGNLKLL